MLRSLTHSVRGKLLLAMLLTTLTALFFTGVAMVIYDLRNYQERLVGDLTAQAGILGRASAPALVFDDPQSAQEYLSLLSLHPNIAAAAIYSAKGKLFASYSKENVYTRPFPILPEQEGSRIQGRELTLFSRIVESNEILGTVYLKADYALLERLKDYLSILGVVMLGSLSVALLVSDRLQFLVTKPILEVTDVARRVMEKRDFSLRAHKITEDEIGYLVHAFNAMLEEVGRRAEALQSSNLSLERAVTEREHAEEALREFNVKLEKRISDRTAQLEDANRELESFSYSVSHDLRAPLRAVVGYSKILIEDHSAELSEEARRKLDVIRSEAERMGLLIDELLAFSRLGRKAIQGIECDMTEMARTAFKHASANHEGNSADFRVGSLPRCIGDRLLLGQVWINLLSNALKFSARKDGPVIEISAISDEREHVYFVRDNGAGFDPRYKSKLFSVFQRLHDPGEFPGTGVGLALVRRVVLRHGGRVWAEGQPGAGATFYFSLPREPKYDDI